MGSGISCILAVDFKVRASRKDHIVITIHHLGVSQSERIVWLMEELVCPIA